MSMKFQILLTLAISLGLVSFAAAQNQPSAPGLSDMRTIKNLGSWLKALGPAFNDQNVRRRVQESIVGNNQYILEQLKWAGRVDAAGTSLERGGFLVRIRTETDLSTNQTVVLGDPILVGVGPDPKRVLAVNGLDALGPVSTSGLRQDSEFLWVMARPKGGGFELMFGRIASPGALTKYALASRAEVDFSRSIAISHRGWLIDGMLSTLRREAASKAEAARALTLLTEFRDREGRLAEYKRDLKKAMDDQAAADRVLTMLDTVGKVLAFATAAAQATAQLRNMSPFDIEDAGDTDRLRRDVELYKMASSEKVRTLGPDIIRLENSVEELRRPVIKVLEEVHMPRNFRESVERP